MCETINSVVSWLLSNFSLVVALAAVIVTLIVGRRTLELMKEQFNQEQKERQAQALGDQRYSILLELNNLREHYRREIGRAADRGDGNRKLDELIPIRHRIRLLLFRPPMGEEERNAIRIATNISITAKAEAAEQIVDGVLRGVGEKLNPILVEDMKNDGEAFTTIMGAFDASKQRKQ